MTYPKLAKLKIIRFDDDDESDVNGGQSLCIAEGTDSLVVLQVGSNGCMSLLDSSGKHWELRNDWSYTQ